MKNSIKTPLMGVLLFCTCFSAVVSADDYRWYDEDEYEREPMVNRDAFYLSVGGVNLNPIKAYEQGVGEDAWYLKGAFSTQTTEHVVLSLGVSGYFYDDYEYFYREVEDDWGDRWDESSNAASLNLFGEIGYRVDIDSNLSIDLVTGYEKILSSNRSISDCDNCYSENIDFSSGVYFSPRVNYVTGSGILLGLSYQTYSSDDFENALTFTIGFSN